MLISKAEKLRPQLSWIISGLSNMYQAAGTATSVSYPAKTSHRAYKKEDLEKAGISLGQLRFSTGIEDAEDILAQLAEALERI